MKKSKNYLVMYIVFGILLLLIPLFVKNSYYRMLFDQTLINIMVVLGLNFITGLTGQTNLGMAGIFAAGAYTSALFTTKLHFSPWIGLILAIMMGLIVGIVLGWPSLRIKGIYLALTTIGFAEIVRLLLTNLAGITGGTQGVMSIPPYNLFGIKIDNERAYYYLLLGILIMLIMLSLRIINSKWGRAFKAIRDNDEAVEACGINIAEIKIIAFCLSTVYACIAGALYAHLMGYINPSDFNIDLSVKYLMMLMLGGIGSVPGSIIGGIVVTTLPEYLRFLKDYYWLIFSVIVLIIVITLPHGLVSIFKNPFKQKKGNAKGGQQSCQL
ncbi:branched-chain amino acid ABC transporter permease [Petroclostridium sp. X23]|uniref:branched-chain amino acid ABC transporter permease n=1 Tax=Petroclostridium sp. X23 TaxID=3045146 RepID=UPI0024AD0713|nr:branched-chain amino acid ABC transporter permease [Petroclostridium sp. X23]WHH58050.1 branched-chain amino acid ABC transporter permease [Petroclostridium sp. X23]